MGGTLFGKSLAKTYPEFRMKFAGTAFTLAEILIVLGIIGLIADMTIPTLLTRTQEKIVVTQLKKAHSTFENALRMAIAENGSPENWNLIDNQSGEGAVNMLNMLAPILNITKKCDLEAGCFPDVNYKSLEGQSILNLNEDQGRAKAQLADGTIFATLTNSADCSVEQHGVKLCGVIYIDINGFKPPNQWGKDFFQLNVTKTGIIPSGAPVFPNEFNNYCLSGGYSCAAWVIYNENMDYLHCNDLSWGGRTSCK